MKTGFFLIHTTSSWRPFLSQNLILLSGNWFFFQVKNGCYPRETVFFLIETTSRWRPFPSQMDFTLEKSFIFLIETTSRWRPFSMSEVDFNLEKLLFPTSCWKPFSDGNLFQIEPFYFSRKPKANYESCLNDSEWFRHAAYKGFGFHSEKDVREWLLSNILPRVA